MTGLPSGSMKAGELVVPGTVVVYKSHAAAGQAGEFRIRGNDKTAGVEPDLIVLEDLITTVRPVAVEVMSPLLRVCGPCHNVVAGVSRLGARKKAKKPTHRAAFIGTAFRTPVKY